MPVAGITALIVLVCGIFITQQIDKSNPFFTTIGRTALALSFCYLMWGCLSFPNNRVVRFFSSDIFSFIGKISYGIFIFHWPVFFAGFALLNKLMLKTGWQLTATSTLLLNALLSVLITFIFSYLSFRYYESFFLKWKKKYSRS
jgi:peptidoglycan/LPS O-acetylase OafA/YrhL